MLLLLQKQQCIAFTFLFFTYLFSEHPENPKVKHDGILYIHNNVWKFTTKDCVPSESSKDIHLMKKIHDGNWDYIKTTPKSNYVCNIRNKIIDILDEDD